METALMNKASQYRNSTGKIHRRMFGAALALAILVPAVLAVSSAEAQSNTESVLYSFTGGVDGSHPYAAVVRDPHGNLYGTTIQGGAFSNGTLFKLDTKGKQTVLNQFPANQGEAALPTGLARDKQGNLYGTTYGGGVYNHGSVFKVDLSGNQTVLYSFSGGADGAEPQAGLVLDAQGNLYGTTQHGGNPPGCSGAGCGTVFKLDPAGHETVLYTFTG